MKSLIETMLPDLKISEWQFGYHSSFGLANGKKEFKDGYNNLSIVVAKDLEDALQKWKDSLPKVYGYGISMVDLWQAQSPSNNTHTHQAHLCFVEPIIKETAEDILRELTNITDKGHLNIGGEGFGQAIAMKEAQEILAIGAKARKFLEGK